MKKPTIVRSCIVLGLLFSATYVTADDKEKFNAKHGSANQSFIETMAKNRAYSNIGDASVTEVSSKEEFQEALESGQLSQEVDNNKITKEYKHIEIKNVRIDQDDLKEIDQDQLLIGSEVDDREKLMQNIEIKNSKIETDKKLNVGVISSGNDVSGITSVNKLDRSSLTGGDNTNNQDMSRIELMEKIESKHLIND